MARILCNVAGGGKPLKGNAEPGDVLAGKTFSNKQSNALTGSMQNNGTNKNAVSVGGGSGSLYAYMPYGYYDNYNNSGNAWINITNDQAKTLANNAGVGYNRGVSDADGRVNTSSASYNSGYANGVTNGKKSPTVTAKGSANVGNYTSTDFYLANGIIVTIGLNGDNLATEQILWKHGATIDVLTTIKSASANFVNLTVDSGNTSHVSAYGRYMTMYIYEFS